MNKTLVASAMTLALGTTATAQAATITITEMVFSGTSAASGTMNDAGNGSTTGSFFNHTWVADQQNWFDTHGQKLTWDDSANTPNGGVYTFTLTDNQVAAGTYFDWNTNFDIAVLTIYDCPVTGPGTCTGESLPMAAGPFEGGQPGFNGTTNDDFPVSGVVPVPAAVWLFGSGLVGLVGVARRRSKKA